jgi:hypothetical protein
VISVRPSLGQALLFSAVFSVMYAICFFGSWGLFAYYPLVGEVHVSGSLTDTLGPPILWYGWVSTSALAAAVAAALMPRAVTIDAWHGVAWLIPALTTLALLIYERRWFL